MRQRLSDHSLNLNSQMIFTQGFICKLEAACRYVGNLIHRPLLPFTVGEVIAAALVGVVVIVSRLIWVSVRVLLNGGKRNSN